MWVAAALASCLGGRGDRGGRDGPYGKIGVSLFSPVRGMAGVARAAEVGHLALAEPSLEPEWMRVGLLGPAPPRTAAKTLPARHPGRLRGRTRVRAT
jgi:hypothetical protein